MKLYPDVQTVKNCAQQGVAFTGRLISGAMAATAGAAATIGFAQLVQRAFDSDIVTKAIQQAVALDDQENQVPYVPAALLVGGCALAWTAKRLCSALSLENRAEEIKELPVDLKKTL